MDLMRDMWEGPLHLRYFIQPLLALALGVMDGLRDGREGRPPFIMGLLRERTGRQDVVGAMIKRLAVPLMLAVGLNLILQLLNRGRVFLLAALIYATVFVVLPYALARAGANRARRLGVHREARIP